MTDQELRALVRDAVARHLGRGSVPAFDVAQAAPSASRGAGPESRVPGLSRVPSPGLVPSQAAARADASHAIYVTLVNTGDACVIEPAVPCNHCNYCKSHGH